MAEMLSMPLQEKLEILALASKSVEMLGAGPDVMNNSVNLIQWNALANRAAPILKRLDTDFPSMLLMPHDGIAWKDR